MNGTVGNSLIETQNEKGIVTFTVDGQDIKLSPSIIRNNLVNGNGKVTDQEILYFLGLCQARKLNPFVKDVYLIKYGDNSPATMVVSKDVLERRAIKNPSYKGKKVGIFVLDKKGEFAKREHTILLQGETLVGAWCEVYRKDWDYPAIAEVNFDEYIGKTKDGKPNTQWLNKPVTMITKVAKAQALREAFIEDLQGMYEIGEIENTQPGIADIIDKPALPEDLRNIMNETAEILEEKKEKEDIVNIL